MNNGTTPDGRVITGLYTDMMGTHSYILSNGTFASFDFFGAVATSAWDMNPSGEIVGVYVDIAVKTRSFLLIHGEFVSIRLSSARCQSHARFRAAVLPNTHYRSRLGGCPWFNA
jgi:hypothetical protein